MSKSGTNLRHDRVVTYHEMSKMGVKTGEKSISIKLQYFQIFCLQNLLGTIN